MAKPTGALLSFGASGTIGKTAVYASWRGRQYVRKWVVPHNPRSSDQTETRSTFTWLTQVWKQAGNDLQQVYFYAALGRPVTDRNLFIKANLSALRGQADLTNFIFSPGAKGGLPPLDATFTGGVGSATIDLDAPSLPTGWSILHAAAGIILDQDPQSGTTYRLPTQNDASAPYSMTFSGLDPGDYLCGGWFMFDKGVTPQQLAWGISLQGTVTVT